MTNQHEQKKKQDEMNAALVCLMGTAIVAIVAGLDGKKAYPELRKLLSQIPR